MSLAAYLWIAYLVPTVVLPLAFAYLVGSGYSPAISALRKAGPDGLIVTLLCWPAALVLFTAWQPIRIAFAAGLHREQLRSRMEWELRGGSPPAQLPSAREVRSGRVAYRPRTVAPRHSPLRPPPTVNPRNPTPRKKAP